MRHTALGDYLHYFLKMASSGLNFVFCALLLVCYIYSGQTLPHFKSNGTTPDYLFLTERSGCTLARFINGSCVKLFCRRSFSIGSMKQASSCHSTSVPYFLPSLCKVVSFVLKGFVRMGSKFCINNLRIKK